MFKPVVWLWSCWALFVFWTLLHPGDGRRRWLGYINGGLADYYRRNLKRLLDYTAIHWFQDQDLLKPSRLEDMHYPHAFGVKTFTEPAFAFSIRLALVYPILSLLVFWGFTGQGGQMGNMGVLPEISVWWQRWLILVGIGVFSGSYYKALTSKGWKKQLTYLIIAFAWLADKLYPILQDKGAASWFWVGFVPFYLLMALGVVYWLA